MVALTPKSQWVKWADFIFSFIHPMSVWWFSLSSITRACGWLVACSGAHVLPTLGRADLWSCPLHTSCLWGGWGGRGVSHLGSEKVRAGETLSAALSQGTPLTQRVREAMPQECVPKDSENAYWQTAQWYESNHLPRPGRISATVGRNKGGRCRDHKTERIRQEH